MLELDLFAIMKGIQARVETIDGMRSAPTIPDTIMPPIAIVSLPSVDYKNGLGRSRMRMQGSIMVFTSKGWTRTGQQQLAEYAGLGTDKSVVRAIDGDRTLGGLGVDCTVSDFRQLTDEEFGEIGYCGGVFTLDII